MAIVELRSIVKVFGRKVRALDGITLAVREGEMLCLLGPSGCGKTTLLRTVAGFEKPTAGHVVMNGKDMTNVPPERRNTALVFQNYALFPHMTVFDNIAFGLKVKRWPMREIRRVVQETLQLVGMTSMEQRWVQQLSGGQQQRVALARALVVSPAVLLLDEPLSNLDAKLRVEMRTHLKDIQRSVGITAIFVTHDQVEALTMADRIAIMHQGQVIQVGFPHEVYNKPNCTFVADFIGKSNFLHGRIDVVDRSEVFILECGERVRVRSDGRIKGEAVLVLRPEQLNLVGPTVLPQEGNVLPGVIEHTEYLGEMVYYYVHLNAGPVVTTVEYGKPIRGWKNGDRVGVAWPADTGMLLKA